MILNLNIIWTLLSCKNKRISIHFDISTCDCLQNMRSDGASINFIMEVSWYFMMTKRLAFFIFVINIVNVINGNFPLPAITPEYCNATEFYDPICVRCKRCGGKDETQTSLQHRGPDGKCNVKCNRIFYKKRSIFRL